MFLPYSSFPCPGITTNTSSQKQVLLDNGHLKGFYLTSHYHDVMRIYYQWNINTPFQVPCKCYNKQHLYMCKAIQIGFFFKTNTTATIFNCSRIKHMHFNDY